MNSTRDDDLAEILESPTKFGLPTFDEFARNPEKYREAADELFKSADHGSDNIRKMVTKHIYFVEGIECKTLEMAERVIKEEGLKMSDMEMYPTIVPDVGLKCQIKVEFKRKKRGLYSPDGEAI